MVQKKVKKKSAKKSLPVQREQITESKRKPVSRDVAIVALILNIIFPGIGSIVGNRIREGIWQLVLGIGGFVIGVLLTIFLGILTGVGAVLGIVVMILLPLAAWIWAIITGIEILKNSER